MPEDDDLRFFNPYADIRQTESRLPHWQQESAVYFVTFRLGDSVPKHLLGPWLDEREAWLKLHPPPLSRELEMEYHRRFSGTIERWLDAGHGRCLLRQPGVLKLVGDALRHFEGERCHQIACAVMPNHVHALFVPRPPWALEKLLHSWKSYTAHEINRQLGEEGSVWQRDYFDRLIRDRGHFANCVRYIRRNPVKARLRTGEFWVWESELARRIE